MLQLIIVHTVVFLLIADVVAHMALYGKRRWYHLIPGFALIKFILYKPKL